MRIRIFIGLLAVVASSLVMNAGRQKVRVEQLDGAMTLSNGNVTASFATQGAFDVLSMRLSGGPELVVAGSNREPWTIVYRGR